MMKIYNCALSEEHVLVFEAETEDNSVLEVLEKKDALAMALFGSEIEVPIILLDGRVAQDEARKEAILAHELGHISNNNLDDFAANSYAKRLLESKGKLKAAQFVIDNLEL